MSRPNLTEITQLNVKVEQIVTRWGERLEARLRKEVGNG